ncbi:hypothetical protein D3C76_241420 [compost metagenome]
MTSLNAFSVPIRTVSVYTSNINVKMRTQNQNGFVYAFLLLHGTTGYANAFLFSALWLIDIWLHNTHRQIPAEFVYLYH